MSDFDDLQGLWKIESMRHGGNMVGHGATHIEFRGDEIQEIDPTHVDGGTWATFVLDETAAPKRFDTTYTYADKKGEPFKRTYHECYELAGDVLRIGGARVFGERPERIDESYATVKTLSRFAGERPATKEASGKGSRTNPVLGTLTWDDTLNQWSATLDFAREDTVSVSITPNDAGDDAAIASGADFITWLRENEPNARAYAAGKMFELAEDWHEEDEEPEAITAESFAARVTLSNVSIDAGGALLDYDDGEIFGGHAIIVSVDANQAFTDVQMMG